MKKTRLFLITALCGIGLGLASCASQGGSGHPAPPEWSGDAVIYEVNVRQFTPEGTFGAFAEHLPRLKDLGVDVLWFMPIHPIGVKERKGALGSYYSISDYKAVNPEFGSFSDFKLLVQAAHSLGFRVIIDWVANHTSRDAKWTANPDWYVLDSAGSPVAPYDWTDVAKLDFNNADMRSAMIDAMLFWVTETEIDGFRCDAAMEVPADFWETAAAEIRSAKADVLMLAEAEEPPLMSRGFDMYYAWSLHHAMNQTAQGKANVDTLRQRLQAMETRFPACAIPLMFTSNHDENSWNGTEFERMGGAAKTFAALTYLLPGMPLIYSGQEVGLNRRLAFFARDPIDWTDEQGFSDFYKGLNDLRRNNPALHSQPQGGALQEIKNSVPDRVFSFVRASPNNRVLAVFNLSGDPQEVTFDTADYNDLKDGLTLQAWEYRIYAQ